MQAKNRYRSRALRALLCSTTAAIAVTALVPAQLQAEEIAEMVYLDTIEVTATKRPAPLGEVDGSVSVRTGEDLEEAGVTSTEDLEKLIPGLIIRERGNRTYSSFSLRGISSPDYYNPSVQVYVDGAPQDTSYFSQELLEVERVEVLRGPQGTLYGRNAHGGVINIITKQPSNEYHGYAGGGYSTHHWQSKAGMSGPLVKDTLFGTVNIKRLDYTGQIDDLSTGNEDIDNSRNWLGNAKFLLSPKDEPFEVEFTAGRDNLKSREELYISEANLDNLKFDSASQGGVNEYSRDVSTYALRASYAFDNATVTSVTSYQNRDMGKRLIQGFDTPEFQDTVSEELRVNFDLGSRWTGIGGVYIQDSEFRRETPAFGGFVGQSQNLVDTTSTAFFGEATYAVTSSIDLTAGLRWSREDASVEYSRVSPGPLSLTDDDSFTDLSPKLSIGWQINDANRVYALASRGFKPGGFNHTVGFTEFDATQNLRYESETSTNIEAGWRGRLFGDVVEAGVSAYYVLTDDKQFYTGPQGSQYIRNAGEAESYGLELDARAHISPALSVDFGGTIGRSTFTSAGNPDTGEEFDGNTIPFAPDYTFQASGRYIIPQKVLPGDVSIRLAGSYSGQTYFDESNTLSQDGYLLLDTSLDVQLDNGLTMRLYVDNITDEIYRTYSYASGSSVFSSVGESRVIGANFRYTF
ncbi:TonB-dependent receptor [Nisaea sp.]|uniref:TonB-dependent receptor n=1 Tax=Nisaea sp. TaxID=2024842 RepID=UPI0032988EBF